jgi:hypothetical protein
MKLLLQFTILAFGIITFIGNTSCKQNVTVNEQVDLHDTLEWNLPPAHLGELLLPPADVMHFLSDIELKRDLSNSPLNVDRYIDTKSKCLNLGIYIADLIYYGFQDDKQNMYETYKPIKQLSSELRIENTYFERYVSDHDLDFQNPDSVFKFSELLQDEMISTLDFDHRQHILAQISVGTFIESLYLITQNLESYENFKTISTDISNQKVIFEQYYEYTSYFLEDENVANLVVELQPLKMFFESLKTKKTEFTYTKDDSGNIILSGGDQLLITPENIEELSSIIEVTRKQLVSN